ncbi:hypothetical protein K5F41_15810 [Acinetobacter baumannii]|nr:hypothetical protein [Acinetobacter baumannii]MCJ9426939.1 hypothetical protein [Acinetobacter baumannii]
MDDKEYFWLTQKKELKTKPKSRPLPKAKEKYLEAEEMNRTGFVGDFFI